MSEDINTLHANEAQNKDKVQPYTSLLKTALWLLVLLLLPQFILGFVYGVYYGAAQIGDNTPEAFDLWFMSVPVLLSLSLISPVITLPLLMKANDDKGQEKNWHNRLECWALQSTRYAPLAKWLAVGVVFWLASTLLGYFLDLPIEQFMLDIKAANNNIAMLVLSLTAICVVVPIMEELTFRGWLYSKIKHTKLGNIGALVLTSLIFTVIHTQYEHTITLAFIFALGILLGLVRYQTNNTYYTIAIHMLYNSLAMISLFMFDA